MAKRIKLIHLNQLLDETNKNGFILDLALYNQDIVPEDETYLLCGGDTEGFLLEESLQMFLEKSNIAIKLIDAKENKVVLRQDHTDYIADIVFNSCACDNEQAHIDFDTLTKQFMKKYYIEIVFAQGDYESNLKQIFKSELTPKEAAHRYILDFYGEEQTEYNPKENWYSMDCDGVIMKLYTIKEVPDSDYEVLKKYI